MEWCICSKNIVCRYYGHCICLHAEDKGHIMAGIVFVFPSDTACVAILFLVPLPIEMGDPDLNGVTLVKKTS